jgi:hypothetical protein
MANELEDIQTTFEAAKDRSIDPEVADEIDFYSAKRLYVYPKLDPGSKVRPLYGQMFPL